MADIILAKHSYYVYAWYGPDGTPFYVGKGRGERMNSLRGRSPAFMTLVAEHGDLPRRKLYEGLTERDAFGLEIDLIAEFGRKEHGGTLLNLTDGGEGLSGYVWSIEMRMRKRAAVLGTVASVETRAKMSATNRGRTKSEAHRKSLSAAHLGKPKSEAHCAAISAAKIGTKQSAETVAKRIAANRIKLDSGDTREKLRKAGLGRLHTAESLAKMSESARNISQETRAKMSAAAQNMSEEHRANISAASKGKPKSAEHCAALKAARILYLAKKRSALAEANN